MKDPFSTAFVHFDLHSKAFTRQVPLAINKPYQQALRKKQDEPPVLEEKPELPTLLKLWKAGIASMA
ncbi:hypothetical protein [Oligoflexus tunisiensis]|uniref:hypothetical protein n=1 Tax=Oligoflexus tunisiensis TaxID=708132 RepID=UPI00114CDE87|nr:hypothetical protein [Oligoflexus tunisiensis]